VLIKVPVVPAAGPANDAAFPAEVSDEKKPGHQGSTLGEPVRAADHLVDPFPLPPAGLSAPRIKSISDWSVKGILRNPTVPAAMASSAILGFSEPAGDNAVRDGILAPEENIDDSHNVDSTP
jgi:hypothetical protein